MVSCPAWSIGSSWWCWNSKRIFFPSISVRGQRSGMVHRFPVVLLKVKKNVSPILFCSFSFQYQNVRGQRSSVVNRSPMEVLKVKRSMFPFCYFSFHFPSNTKASDTIWDSMWVSTVFEHGFWDEFSPNNQNEHGSSPHMLLTLQAFPARSFASTSHTFSAFWL